MTPTLFTRFRDLIYEQSGISLAPSKQVLLQSRIGKRMRSLELGDEDAYLKHVINDKSGDELVLLLDAISTNTTHFFRESDHFDRFREDLAGMLAAGQSRIRVWSAACSTGQEPYTIGMTALDTIQQLGKTAVDLRILATDISTKVLGKAMQGEYPERELDRVSPEYRRRYLRVVNKAPKTYGVTDELRRLVTFRRLNLSKRPFPMQGPFDVIFCRNVMIYFDQAVRAQLVSEMTRLLKPHGMLFIGHAESLLGIDSGLVTLAPSVYQKAA